MNKLLGYALSRSQYLVFILLLTLGTTKAYAQPGLVLDESIAQVGEEVIFKSDLMEEVMDIQRSGNAKYYKGRLECGVLGEMLITKLLLHAAKTDTLIDISEEQLMDDLNRRMEYMIEAQFKGSEEELERFYKRSLEEVKLDLKPRVLELLLVQEQVKKMEASVEIAPSEVREFFNSIPVDSLPYFSAEYELGQIVLFPRVAMAEKLAARAKLDQIRKTIAAGGNFEIEALTVSEDPGVSVNRGHIGMIKASNLDPNYGNAALIMQKGGDTIVESQFGLHLMYLVDRNGENVNTNHILIKPIPTPEGIDQVTKQLDSIRILFINKGMPFDKLAYEFSEDKETKNTGGFLMSGSNSSKIPADQLDASLFSAINSLDVGQVSAPLPYTDKTGKKGFRILYVKSKTKPHRANLDEDYERIKEQALERKKLKQKELWVLKQLKKVYTRISDEYLDCEALKPWRKTEKVWKEK